MERRIRGKLEMGHTKLCNMNCMRLLRREHWLAFARRIKPREAAADGQPHTLEYWSTPCAHYWNTSGLLWWSSVPFLCPLCQIGPRTVGTPCASLSFVSSFDQGSLTSSSSHYVGSCIKVKCMYRIKPYPPQRLVKRPQEMITVSPA